MGFCSKPRVTSLLHQGQRRCLEARLAEQASRCPRATARSQSRASRQLALFALDRSQLNVPGWLLGGSKQRWVGKRVSLENTGVTAGRQLRPGTLHGKGSWCWKHLAGYGQSCLRVSSFFNDTAPTDARLVPSFLGRARQADPHSPPQMRGFAGRGRASCARLRALWNVRLCLKGAEMFGYG